MKFTVAFITLLCISTSWAVVKNQKTKEEMKDKREAPVGYPSSGHSPQSYQGPSFGGHEDASAISVGAGYSIGGAKPSFSFGGQGSGAALQLSPEGLQSGGHATLQLAPITLQPSSGALVGSDLSQLMSQLSHGLNSGSLSLQSPNFGGLPAFSGGHVSGGGQELALSQLTYGAPKLQFSGAQQSLSSVPSYAAGTKGLGSYSSAGPVLFNPSESHSSQPALAFGASSAGHSFGDANGLSLGGSGHSLGGLSLGGSGSGHSLSGLSLGGSGSGHSLGGLSLGGSGSFGGSLKSLGGSYVVPSKTSFKPSTFLGASVQSDSGHGLSSLSGSYGSPFLGSSFSGGHSGLSLGSAGHGASFGGSLGGFGGGSSKFVSSSYLPAKSSEGFGSSLESVAALSNSGQLSSPPGTTYGVPTNSYGVPVNTAHSASSTNPRYLMPSKSSSSGSFGEGSSSYKGPVSGSLSSLSSGPKYSFGGQVGSRYGAPKDTHGSYSESTYNTIKYSAELKPHVH